MKTLVVPYSNLLLFLGKRAPVLLDRREQKAQIVMWQNLAIRCKTKLNKALYESENAA